MAEHLRRLAARVPAEGVEAVSQVQPGICTRCRHPQHLHPADRNRRCISPLCGCEAFEGEEISPKLTNQVGGHEPLETDDPLVVLIYVLLRDHIQAGLFEKLVAEMVAAPVSLTNAVLRGYAANIADRIRLLNPPAAAFVLTTDEREAFQDVISVASRAGGPFEVYGGVEVQEAVLVATDALNRMDEELPLPVDISSEAEKVRIELADLLTTARTKLLQKVATDTREDSREGMMAADEVLEEIFNAFCPERWKRELAEFEREERNGDEPATGGDGS